MNRPGCHEVSAAEEQAIMGENRYFQKALSDFTYEAASGGAIRHLADSGYTVRQIVENLDFPTSYERVQKAVWEHLLRQGTILLERPDRGGQKESVRYVREYDRYGKASFRRVAVQEEGATVKDWRIKILGRREKTTEEMFILLRDKRDANGQEYAFASFDLGLVRRRNPQQYEAMLSALEENQKEYVSGLPWEGQRVYHRLDFQGLAMLIQLYRAGQYQGECFFLKTGEILQIE